MAIVKCGDGIVEIRGSIGGVYFHRDKTGLHCCSQPRTVHRRTGSQNVQRRAFTRARTFSTDNRVVSWLIYRCLNGLPIAPYPEVTGSPVPDCTGRYVRAGLYDSQNYYEREDSAFSIWYDSVPDDWIISLALGIRGVNYWWRDSEVFGSYFPVAAATGNPVFSLTPYLPPPDYQIPRLQGP